MTIKFFGKKELYSKIEKLVTDITSYLHRNRLVPNSSESKLMMSSSRPTQNLCDDVFAGEVVEWVNEFKYLGLSLTNKLCFCSHINKIVLNISRTTGLFSNLRNIIPGSVMMKLFYALAYPQLINHITAWGAAPTTHLKVLSTRLNNMLRVILGIRWINGRPNVSANYMYKSNN